MRVIRTCLPKDLRAQREGCAVAMVGGQGRPRIAQGHERIEQLRGEEEGERAERRLPRGGILARSGAAGGFAARVKPH